MAYISQNYTGADYAAAIPGMFKEAVGVFKDAHELQGAIRVLEGTSFPRHDISVMGSQSELEKIFGVRSVPPQFAMDNPDTPREAPARPEEQTIGAAGMIGGATYVGAIAMALAAGAATFPAIVTAAVIGGVGGGSIGAILAKLLGDRYTQNIQEQIERGGLLLWVRTPDKEREDLAMKIMRSCGAHDVHIHEII